MLRRRNLLMFLAMAGEDVLIDIVCEILLSSSANIKTTATLEKFNLSAETKADIIAFLEAKIPFRLNIETKATSLSDTVLNTRQTIDMLVNDPKMIYLEAIIELVVKRVSDIFVNEKFLSIVDARFNSDQAVNMDNATKIKTIIKDQFNAVTSVNVGNIINSVADIKEQFNIDIASEILSEIEARAIIKEQFNIDIASEILSEIEARAIIKEQFNIAAARKILVNQGIDLSNDINLHTSDIAHIIGQNNSISNNYFKMWAIKPVYMTTPTSDVVSEGLIVSLNKVQPIHITSNEKCITFGNVRSILKTPLHFTASGDLNLNGKGTMDTRSTSHISANIVVKSVSNADMSMKKDVWEYPIWLTDTNLKITQAKIITRNNNSLEVE